MKLFGKLFITMMCVIILSYMTVGNILVQTAFQTMINRETESSMEEMKIFQYALVASLKGLPKGYQATDLATGEIAKSIQQSLHNTQSTMVIYNKENKVIYQNSHYQSDLIQKADQISSGAWRLTKRQGHYYLESLCKISHDKKRYLLEIHREIDHIYQDRDRLYDRYRLILMIIFAVTAVVLLIFSVRFTYPIRKLSQATRAFANGDYKSRVRERGHDEVAVLGQDFNQMAQQLETSIGQLEETARRQEEFTEAFSHELKTPLTSMIGYADMLRSMDLTEEEIVLSADYIFQQGKRLERLAKKMMELSYIDKQELTIQKIDVISFVCQVEKMTEGLLQPKKIYFTSHIEPGSFYGDLDLLFSLFSNLIDNARKACGGNGVIALTGMRTEGGYCFRIRDNGQGMPKEEIHKITEPFYMIDKSRARKEGGAGIGMTLCQKIVSLHHAEWEIQSKWGEGTEIRIRFPMMRIKGRESEEAMDSKEATGSGEAVCREEVACEEKAVGGEEPGSHE